MTTWLRVGGPLSSKADKHNIITVLWARPCLRSKFHECRDFSSTDRTAWALLSALVVKPRVICKSLTSDCCCAGSIYSVTLSSDTYSIPQPDQPANFLLVATGQPNYCHHTEKGHYFSVILKPLGSCFKIHSWLLTITDHWPRHCFQIFLCCHRLVWVYWLLYALGVSYIPFLLSGLG